MNRTVRPFGLASIAAFICACGQIEVDPPAERVFPSAFEPSANSSALPYDEQFGPLKAISQATVFDENFTLSQSKLGFVRSCSVLPRGILLEVGAFDIMAFEVTAKAHDRCVSQGKCAPVSERAELDPDPSPLGAPSRTLRPVAVDSAAAEGFCRAYGGELPTIGQWLTAAHATADSIGLTWVSGKFPSCFSTPREPLCVEYEQSDDKPRREQPGEQPFALRDVGTTAWDVSAEGVYDLYGNADEWLRRPAREAPYARTCNVPTVTDADFFRGPPAAPTGSIESLAAAPAQAFNSVWFELDAIASEQPPSGGLPGPFTIVAGRSKRPRPLYRDGFRCVFPKGSLKHLIASGWPALPHAAPTRRPKNETAEFLSRSTRAQDYRMPLRPTMLSRPLVVALAPVAASSSTPGPSGGRTTRGPLVDDRGYTLPARDPSGSRSVRYETDLGHAGARRNRPALREGLLP